MPVCKVSGEEFEYSALEQRIRDKLTVPMPTISPKSAFQHLGAFWQHFALHKRKSDFSQEEIISVFDEHCPYPVWHRDEWVKNANPSFAGYNFDKPFFDQLWELFQKCPMPHMIGGGNENCEYTDDWWHSKNCYLCHSGVDNEDLYYCYRVGRCRSSLFAVFCFDCELCTDLVSCDNCYNVTYAINSAYCRDSYFLFDCRNCSDCLFCFNLRNKQYCIGNKQLTREEFETEKAKYNFSSFKHYEKAKEEFAQTITTQAWWRTLQVNKCENVTGNYLQNDKNMDNCFFLEESEDCANYFRGYKLKDVSSSVGCFNIELAVGSVLTQDGSYDARFCFNVINSRFMEYSMNCLNCEHCFACSGLVGKKYHILNKEYSPEEYGTIKEKIVQQLRDQDIYGDFFPGHFAPCSYEESLAQVYWPLSHEEQKQKGLRVKADTNYPVHEYLTQDDIPDDSLSANDNICKKAFWDETAKKPFTILKSDLEFCQRQKIPLPHGYYVPRIKENFAWLFFDGALRETTCAKTGKRVLTTLPAKLDGRILSEEAYLETIVG